MPSHRRWRVRAPATGSAAALVGGVVLSGVALTSAAQAASSATAGQPQSVTSGTWSAVASTASSPPYGTGPASFFFAISSVLSAPRFVTIANTGTLSLSAATYAVSATNNAAVLLESCSTGWVVATNTCAGTVSTITSATGPATSSPVTPTTPGATLTLRVRPTSILTLGSTVTINVSVDRTQVRPGATTTS